ncbi:MAG: molybdate ABC transporter substrate-binding protein [Proteobacteria bacterium]|nr:molybdate ABC transporter substrate-binding protein [Pseudomonadota bacterium]NCA27717.1 molybdate ABC transporter substrate-binding protein [Pseudomonadota bacterium]
MTKTHSFSLKFRPYFCIFLCVFGLTFFTNPNSTLGAPSRNITVFAEPNIASVLSKIARNFSQKNNVIVSINFSSAFDLLGEIDQGAPANVFISANPQIIENLRQKGLVDVYNIAYIANDILTLCTSKNNNRFPINLLKKNITFEESLKIIDENKLNLIIEHEGISSGFHGKKIIQELSLGNIKLFTKLPEDKSSLIRDIENNKDTYGIVFLSQLHKNNNLRALSTQKDKNIFYQAFVIAGENMDIAREFLNFLKNQNSKNIFKESGLLVE